MSEDSGTNSSIHSSSFGLTDSSCGSTVCIANKFTELLKKEGKIGSGGFGSVYRCSHILEEKEYAVKRIKLKNNKKEFEWYLREVRAMSSLEHKNVVRYYQSWTDLCWDGFSSSSNGSDESSDNEGQSDESSDNEGQSDESSDNEGQSDMEYCPRTLKSVLKMNPTNNQEALGYLRGLLDGLDYIHRSGYLHRDLTKKNIFFGKDNNIKIGDFGLAKKLVGSEDYMYCSQSPHPTSIRIGLHRAPELLENEPYTRKSDMYGLGIIFLEMLLSPLDTAHERINIIEQIKKGQYPGEWENKFETAVLKKLLAESPDDRPYADELIQFIDH